MNPGTILLVEDNPSDIDLTRRALAKCSVAHQLVVAEDGQEAVDYLFGGKHNPALEPDQMPSLVLLDLNLPRTDGFEVLRRIRSNDITRRLPVVVLTTSLEKNDVGECYDLGANSYIRKPVDFAQFVQSISHVVLYWLVLNEQPPPKTR